MPEQIDANASGKENPAFTSPDCIIIAIDPATDFMLLETKEPEPRRVLFGLSRYASASGVEANRFEPGAVISWREPDNEADLTGKIKITPPADASKDEDTSAIIAEFLNAGTIK